MCAVYRCFNLLFYLFIIILLPHFKAAYATFWSPPFSCILPAPPGSAQPLKYFVYKITVNIFLKYITSKKKTLLKNECVSLNLSVSTLS